ncbi:MAG: Maf family protein [Phycisphaeraceae bacterium]|nr:Maf family protein [Phycisphaeraceae bacterium]
MHACRDRTKADANARCGPVGPIVLASTSPRRRDLLSRTGLTFETIDPGIDDGDLEPGAASAGAIAMALAHLKARAGQERARELGLHARIVIGADTLCVQRGTLIGKPEDACDAREIIEGFENDDHEVVTGVSILDLEGSRRDLFVERAFVRVGTIGMERIDEYLATGLWMGKAGAYNLEERLAAGWPIEFEGDAGTIVGLPVRRLMERLCAMGLAGVAA